MQSSITIFLSEGKALEVKKAVYYLASSGKECRRWGLEASSVWGVHATVPEQGVWEVPGPIREFLVSRLKAWKGLNEWSKV